MRIELCLDQCLNGDSQVEAPFIVNRAVCLLYCTGPEIDKHGFDTVQVAPSLPVRLRAPVVIHTDRIFAQIPVF